jgi:hypothetical protein
MCTGQEKDEHSHFDNVIASRGFSALGLSAQALLRLSKDGDLQLSNR